MIPQNRNTLATPLVPPSGQTQAQISCGRCGGSGRDPSQVANLDRISLADVVRGTGLSWSMVSRIFSTNPKQRRSPSIRTAKRLSDFLGIDLDTLYRVLEDDNDALEEGDGADEDSE